jgi:hypothetical protein
MKQCIVAVCVLLLSGCQSTSPLSVKNDPKADSWELAFTEPYYMKVWVEDSAVEDINGKLFTRTGGGTAAGGEPENGKESARASPNTFCDFWGDPTS